jgi:Sel1 repeat/PDZ domain/HEAT repeats
MTGQSFRFNISALACSFLFVCLGIAAYGQDDQQAIITGCLKALESPNATVRKQSAIGLGEMGPKAKSARIHLQKLLKDPDAGVQAAVAEALEKIGAAATPEKEKNDPAALPKEQENTSDAAKAPQQDKPSKGGLNQARLAVRLSQVAPSYAERWKLAAAGQPQVVFVVPGGGGAQSGLKSNDVILRVNGQDVKSVEQVASAVKPLGRGDRVVFVVHRDGEQVTLTGSFQTKFDVVEEMRRTKEAAATDAAAQTYLGSMYEQGRGAEKNEAEAVKWYSKAADQGDASA